MCPLWLTSAKIHILAHTHSSFSGWCRQWWELTEVERLAESNMTTGQNMKGSSWRIPHKKLCPLQTKPFWISWTSAPSVLQRTDLVQNNCRTNWIIFYFETSGVRTFSFLFRVFSLSRTMCANGSVFVQRKNAYYYLNLIFSSLESDRSNGYHHGYSVFTWKNLFVTVPHTSKAEL